MDDPGTCSHDTRPAQLPLAESGEKIMMIRIIRYFFWAAIALSAWKPLDAMTLDEAVWKALTNNPQIQEARAEAAAVRDRKSVV